MQVQIANVSKSISDIKSNTIDLDQKVSSLSSSQSVLRQEVSSLRSIYWRPIVSDRSSTHVEKTLSTVLENYPESHTDLESALY